uniref:Phosphoserine phosphatase n=1 Tax=Strongyloides stercoralis TaxID=6248 RepID=A0A0K0EG56_STRER
MTFFSSLLTTNKFYPLICKHSFSLYHKIILRMVYETTNANGVIISEKNLKNIKLTSLEEDSFEEDTKKVWRNVDAVCFDVDSTVCQDEAIDEFAKYLGCGDEVANCTKNAMCGSMTFREALKLRLDIMKPSQEQFLRYIENYKPLLTKDIINLIKALQIKGTTVYLVSGGFRKIIIPVAKQLGINEMNIYANEIIFDDKGNYIGFDKNEYTSDSGNDNVGKAGVCKMLKKKYGYKNLVMIGDGATDAEACPPADAFIGFGGNVIREPVVKLANWYVYDFKTLIDELKKK